MTKLIEVGSGRIVLRDTNGATRFDSDEKLFQATSRVAGTTIVGPWTASYDGGSTIVDVVTDVDHYLTAVNSACDAVVGSFYVTTSDGKGIAGLGWFNANGTYLHHFASAHPTLQVVCQQFSTFTFFAASGGLYLNERVLLRANVGIGVPANTVTLTQITFDYNLYCGSFV